MNREEAEEYTHSLTEVGAGLARSAGGWWRQRAQAVRLGIPAQLGMTREQWIGQLDAAVQLPRLERREAVKELADDGLNKREIADVLGVDETTVRRDAANAAPTQPDQQLHDDIAANAAPEPIRIHGNCIIAEPEPLTAEQLAEQHEWEEEAKQMAEKQRLAEEQRRYLAEMYSNIAQALSTLGGYGRYEDIPNLMRDFDPTQLDPPVLDQYFDVGNLQDAQRFCAEAMKWRKNDAG